MTANDDGAGSFEGGCTCGRLRFRMRSEPILVNCCHCRDCQRQTGSAFALNGMIEADRVEPIGPNWADRDQVGTRAGARSWRCAECGVLLYAEHPRFGDHMRFVRLGALACGEQFTPDAHFFVRSRHPWVALPNGVPAYETLPPDGAGPEPRPVARARLAAALE